MGRLTELLARLDRDPRVTVAVNGSFVTDPPKEDAIEYNSRRDPFADHPMHCKCYFHR